MRGVVELMKKRLLSFTLSVVMALSLVSPALAVEQSTDAMNNTHVHETQEPESGERQILSAGLYWTYNQGTKTLNITGDGTMPDLDDAGSYPWSQWSDEAEVLYVEEGVSNISAHSFQNFGKLVLVEAAGELQSIGEEAFKDSENLVAFVGSMTSDDAIAVAHPTAFEGTQLGQGLEGSIDEANGVQSIAGTFPCGGCGRDIRMTSEMNSGIVWHKNCPGGGSDSDHRMLFNGIYYYATHGADGWIHEVRTMIKIGNGYQTQCTQGAMNYFVYCPYCNDLHATNTSGWTAIDSTHFIHRCWNNIDVYSINDTSGKIEITGSATCTQAGSATFKCNQCGDVSGSIQLAPLGHNMSSWKNNGDVNTHVKTCSRCDYTETQNHSFTAWSNLSGGQHSRRCTVCNYQQTGAHDFGAWSDVGGTQHRHTCQTCNFVETGAHQFSEWTDINDTQHQRICSGCNRVESQNHDLNPVWTDNHDWTHSNACQTCAHPFNEEHTWQADDKCSKCSAERVLVEFKLMMEKVQGGWTETVRTKYYLAGTDASITDVFSADEIAAPAGLFEDTSESNRTLSNISKENKTITLKYDREAFVVDFDVDGGSFVNAQLVVYGGYVQAPDVTPTKEGFTFNGWWKNKECTEKFLFTEPITQNTTIYAKWNPDTGVQWTINNYMQNVQQNDYDLGETLIRNDGITGQETQVFVKDYTGFHQNISRSDKTVMMRDDGTTEADVYYYRNVWTSKVPQNDGSVTVSTHVYGDGTFVDPVRKGYTFDHWVDQFGATFSSSYVPFDGDVMTAVFNPAEVDYTVVHMVPELGTGDMKEHSRQTFRALSESEVTASPVDITGFHFTSATTENVDPEGTTVVYVYYARNEWDTDVDGVVAHHVYGDGTFVDPVKEGYLFQYWYVSGAENVEIHDEDDVQHGSTLYAKFEPRTDIAYKVEHYVQNVLDDNYTLYTTESKNDGVMGEVVVAIPMADADSLGFVLDSGNENEIASAQTVADGSLVLKLYYNRKAISWTLDDTVDNGRYGITIGDLQRPNKVGYDFLGFAKIDQVAGTESDVANEYVINDGDVFQSKWKPSEGVAYTVYVWISNDGGKTYDEANRQQFDLSGTTGQTVNYTYTPAEGYELDVEHDGYADSGTVLADGSLVLNIYVKSIMYTVTYKDGETVLKTEEVNHGTVLSSTMTPTKDGYTFKGWKNEDGTNFDATKPITQDVTLLASWEQKVISGGGGGSSSSDDDGKSMTNYNGHSDIAPGDWYYDYLSNAIFRGYMEDKRSGGTYGANRAISRADLAYAIKNIMAGYDANGSTSGIDRFDDVSNYTDHYEEIGWNNDNGFMAGYGPGMDGVERFGPEDNLTREQFAVVLYRVFGSLVNGGDYVDLSKYVDEGDIGDWAREGVQWAVNNGFMVGTSETTLLPGGTVSNAQAATMLMRMVVTIENQGKKDVIHPMEQIGEEPYRIMHGQGNSKDLVTSDKQLDDLIEQGWAEKRQK